MSRFSYFRVSILSNQGSCSKHYILFDLKQVNSNYTSQSFLIKVVVLNFISPDSAIFLGGDELVALSQSFLIKVVVLNKTLIHLRE
jgi:hypothetical protein